MTQGELDQLKDRVCPCCMLDPSIKQYRLCSSTKDFGELGSGYVAFFSLSKLCIGLCFVFILANIYKIRANSQSTFCFSPADPSYEHVKTLPGVCVRDWITVHSIANYGYAVDNTDKAIIIAYFGVCLLIFIFFYPHMNDLTEVIDKKSDMPSDWTVEVL